LLSSCDKLNKYNWYQYFKSLNPTDMQSFYDEISEIVPVVDAHMMRMSASDGIT